MQSKNLEPVKEAAFSEPLPHHATFNYGSYRWVVAKQGLCMLPNSAKRNFNWSYFLSRTLHRLNPGRYF